MNALTDFSQPQRQSLLGVLVMFANTLQKIVRAMWPILLVWLVKLDASNTLFIYLGIVAFVLIIVKFHARWLFLPCMILKNVPYLDFRRRY